MVAGGRAHADRIIIYGGSMLRLLPKSAFALCIIARLDMGCGVNMAVRLELTSCAACSLRACVLTQQDGTGNNVCRGEAGERR